MTFAHISRPIRQVTGQTFARKFITLGRVINYWAEAVGPDLAGKTYPIGMKVRKAAPKPGTKPIPPKSPMTKTPLEAVLEIAASSADATLLHYQKNLILERLHLLLGARMIVDIKITHGALPPLPAPAHVSATPTQDVAPQTSSPQIQPDDDDLQMALDRLYTAITHQPPQNKN